MNFSMYFALTTNNITSSKTGHDVEVVVMVLSIIVHERVHACMCVIFNLQVYLLFKKQQGETVSV